MHYTVDQEICLPVGLLGFDSIDDGHVTPIVEYARCHDKLSTNENAIHKLHLHNFHHILFFPWVNPKHHFYKSIIFHF